MKQDERPVTHSTLVWLVGLIALLLTLLLYGPVVGLPFYSDDLLQVPWVEATPLAELWRTVGPYRDYRPLHFTLWRLVYLATGDLRPTPLHALNLLGHALAGTLTGLLAARWGERPRLMGSLAAALFVAFPFAFDAVPWAIALSYPLAVSLTLGGLLLYLEARERTRLLLHLPAMALVALAGFAHEGAVVAGAAILLAEVFLQRNDRRLSRWPTPYVGLSLLPLAAAALARPQGTVLHGLEWPGLVYSAAYALQALTFPLAPLGGPLVRAGLNPAVTVAGTSLALFFFVTLVTTRRRLKVPSHLPALGLLALGWWVLWALPPLLTLRFDWLRDAPRALYPLAVSAALLWGGAIAALADLSRRRRSPPLPAAALALLCLIPAVTFVAGRVSLQRRAGHLLEQVIEMAQEGESLLVVNLPGRIAPAESFYPLGYEGLIPLPLPPRVHAADLVAANGGPRDAAFERTYGTVFPLVPERIALFGDPLAVEDVRRADRVALVTYRPGEMELAEAGAVLPPQPAGTARARFGESLRMLSASCHWDETGRAVLDVQWQIQAPIEGTPTIFAHLLGPDGTLLAQADGPPLRGLYPLQTGQPGEIIHDVRTFEGVTPQVGAIAVGVWDPEAGVRWEARDPSGQLLTDDAYRCPLAIRILLQDEG